MVADADYEVAKLILGETQLCLQQAKQRIAALEAENARLRDEKADLHTHARARQRLNMEGGMDKKDIQERIEQALKSIESEFNYAVTVYIDSFSEEPSEAVVATATIVMLPLEKDKP